MHKCWGANYGVPTEGGRRNAAPTEKCGRQLWRPYGHSLFPIAYSLFPRSPTPYSLFPTPYLSTFTIGAVTAEKVRSVPLMKRIFTRCSAPCPVSATTVPLPNTR